MFSIIDDFVNKRSSLSELLEDSESQRIKSILKSFVAQTEEVPGIRVKVYIPDDANQALTQSENEGIKECLSWGCHFYKKNDKGDITKVLGFRLDFIENILNKYEESSQYLKPVLSIILQQIEQAVKAA